MHKDKKIVAIIPVRGGSKSIPYKNIKEIAGKPLVRWNCEAIKESKYIDELYVSTEDQKIKDVVSSFDLGVKIIDRPAEFAADTSSTESAIMDFVREEKNYDILMLFQATSPLTTSENIDEAIENFFAEENDSLFTGVISKRIFWTPEVRPLNYDPAKRPRRQDFAGSIMENGAFYITKKEIWEKHNNRLGGKVGVYIMPEHMGVEIDEPTDWEMMEKLLLKYKQ
ncbi:acylneuraminate cytidylyltransferase family protein [Candidatus Parcubacteria bacterium]|nr:acylneuraminate cytidylyltransferase family protein [Candidatus Parcubacteria bacterium]MCG2694422.1 acylneuraminate cytidylyltransferase family protein [Candidatus Parcubacteria bacterium]